MTSSITITDTGKRRVTSASAEETDKANNGAAITLYGVEVTFDNSALLNTAPSIGKLRDGEATMFVAGESDVIGINLSKITVRGVLRDNVTADLQKIKLLREIVTTKGYKTISGTLFDWIDGSSNDSTVNVRVQSVTLTHRSNTNIIDYNIVMFET